jgi:hypothetical protein
MIECVIELKSTNQLWEILSDLKKLNVLRSQDFEFAYVPPVVGYELDNGQITNIKSKRVIFYFKDEKYATYLKLLYT